jgi:hypothetical protein
LRKPVARLLGEAPAAARRQGAAAAQAQAQAPEIAVAAAENPLVVSDRMGFQGQVYALPE